MRRKELMKLLRLTGLCGGFALFALLLLPGALLIFFGDANSSVENGEHIVPPKTIQVYRTASGTVESIDFEEYVKGVVAGEMPANFAEEALKAQAVAARTYSLSKVIRSGDGGFPAAHPNAPLCDDTHCQVYRSPAELESLKGSDWMNDGYKKITKAVEDTAGVLMYYNGELAYQALFHSSSGGKTENSEDVFVTGDFVPDGIKINDRTDGGRVNSIQIGNAAYSGSEIRDALGLASANFNIVKEPYTIVFTTNGYGHGVGMSQYGANGMAEAGFDYKEILKHYYTGVAVY